jgi:hypothetical protein
MMFCKTLLGGSALLLGLLVSAVPAQAQRGASANQAPLPKAVPRPSAVPGTKTDAVAPAPAQKLPGEMNPTDALFDGINRGDLASVKDAITRGAELDARNILGLSPLELSIDLGYQNISFLLLSLRDSGGGSRSGPPAGSKTAKAAKPARPEPGPKAITGPVPSAYPTAKQFARDGGAPVPDRGFLGFGPRQ